LSNVASTPFRLKAENVLIGKAIDDKVLEATGEAAPKKSPSMSWFRRIPERDDRLLETSGTQGS
jgi:hypothetical protein